ncbi:MAG: translesion DNA synthesis-associated protein ImuA [Steroidobacteraceae bacterium]
MATDLRLAQLLEHPAIWRGRSAARGATHSTGFPALDEGLPGGGWPRAGLIEILTPRHGVGELRLVMPLLARLSLVQPARWASWIAPPFEPYAPALAAQGLALERQLVVRTETPLWAMEQALGSGACEVVLAWARRAQATSVRRLQLATERGRTPGFLFRALSSAREASPAELRLQFEPLAGGGCVRLLKSRGGTRERIELHWESGPHEPA